MYVRIHLQTQIKVYHFTVHILSDDDILQENQEMYLIFPYQSQFYHVCRFVYEIFFDMFQKQRNSQKEFLEQQQE